MKKHPEYARCLITLKKAESVAVLAMEIRKNVLGENDPSYARSLNSLAELYALMGQYEKAEPLIKSVTEIRRKALGENHIDYGSGLYFQAELKALSGKNEEAEKTLLISD
ncbi:MAG: tetratricopeptide repeat protein [Chitinophagaceae bacterium]|nr:tetratricopeptide repeat protein [Chitinophagaceae bacterium]